MNPLRAIICPTGHFQIDITPVAKPRQTRSDKWKQRPCVMRYRAFADEIRLRVGSIDLNHYTLTFGLPMPKSWSKKKKAEYEGQPHQQKPDVDNLCKSVLDSLYQDDCHIHDIALKKVWARNGFILFEIDK